MARVCGGKQSLDVRIAKRNPCALRGPDLLDEGRVISVLLQNLRVETVQFLVCTLIFPPGVLVQLQLRLAREAETE